MAKKKNDSKFLEEIDFSAEDILNSSEERLENIIKAKKAYIEYQEVLKDINKKLKSNKELTEEDKKLLKEKLDSYKKIQEEIKKENELLDEGKILRELNNELQEKENKFLREGATLNERITHYIEKAAVAHGVNINKIKTYFNEAKSGVNNIISGVKEINESWGKVDQASFDFGKRMGSNKETIEELRKSTIDFVESTRGIYGSMEEIIKLQGDYNVSIGRSISLTKEQKENLGALKGLVGEQTAIEFSAKLENFGLNPEEVGKRVGKMFSNASKSGLAFETYSKNFLNNIKLAQNYTFKRGLEGLEAMARKSTAIRLDMQQTANFADKVSTLEGAVEASAQLSVLGGDFAKYSNPLTMMYEGLNDMESLQDRVVKMFGDVGKWDYSKGQVDVSVFNRERLKRAAPAMGMDYSSIMEMINNNARRNIIESKLNGVYDEDTKELILNKAQLDKEGNAKVNVAGESVDVNSLTNDQINYLKNENRSESEILTEINQRLAGFGDINKRYEDTKAASSAQINETIGIGELTKKALGELTEQTGLMRIIAGVSPGFKLLGGLLGMIHGILMGISTSLKFGRSIGGVEDTSGTVGTGGGLPGAGGKNSVVPPRPGKGGFFRNAAASTLKWGRKGGGASRMVAKTGAGLLKAGATVGTAGLRFAKAATGPAGLVALGSNLAEGGIDSYYSDKKKDNWYVAGKAASKAAEFGAYGAMVGAMFGGVGAPIGAAIGAAAGGIYGGYSAYKDKKKGELIASIQAIGTPHIHDYEVYDNDELETMTKGVGSVPLSLLKKMEENGDSFKKGGYTGDGDVNDIAGVVHKGEIVIPNEVTKEIIKPNGDLMNNISVKNDVAAKDTKTEQSVSFSPININLSGSIELKSNGYNSKVEAKDLMTPEIIDKIIKEIQIRTNYSLNRDKTHIKFG